MRPAIKSLLVFLAIFVILLLLHLPLLCLPYFWDEAGYYIPAALDFYHSGLLIPATTLPTGHTPLVPVYLGLVWHLLGCSIWTARAAMTLIA
ncbi:MAG TPA: glycosyltransferase, partial [Terriglobia bacterium]|nr:glycosyltransferase [Terriglobia bacterium]